MKRSEYLNIYLQEESHFFYVSLHDAVLKLVNNYFKKSKLKILDAGCGTGMLMKRLENFGQIYGVDISSEAIKYSKMRQIKRVQKASVTRLPFKNEVFDLIVSMDVIYHIKVKDDLKALKEFYRVLKPGGLLIIKVPAYQWLRAYHDVVVQTRQRYDKKELKNKINSTGFIIRKLTSLYFFLLPVVLIKRFIENFLNSEPSSEIGKLPNLINLVFLGIASLETKIALKTNLPFGISILAVAQKPKSSNKITSRK